MRLADVVHPFEHQQSACSNPGLRSLSSVGGIARRARLIAQTCLLTLSITATCSADATDLAVVSGEGDGVQVAAVGGQALNWQSGLLGERWWYEVSGEWQLARWSAEDAPDGVRTLLDGSLTAVLTLRPSIWRTSYVEGGFGIHLLSEDRIGTDRDLGWRFQFGEFLGAGLNLGAKHQYAFGLRIQHVSNGSTKAENDGVTFVQGVIRYSF